MYAIIQDGGKQYKVIPGQTVEVDRKDCAPGTPVEFTNVIYFKDKEESIFGTPFISNIKVKGVVEKQTQGKKMTIIKYKRREMYRQKRGYRGKYTLVRIQKIVKE